MLKVLLARARFGNRTIGFPDEPPTLPERFAGRPVMAHDTCRDGCSECLQVCPTAAVTVSAGHPVIDIGRCLFCGECEKACAPGLIRFTNDFSLAANERTELVVHHTSERARVRRLRDESLRLFKRSLRLRQVSAGGCNGCEVEVNVLGTIVYDLGRFGIQFVASPRHADGLLITGPVTANMRLALQKTYEATPDPKIVIAVGACAISGGPYVDHPQVHNGAAGELPIDLFIPGCPPHPITILDGLLQLLARMPEPRASAQKLTGSPGQ
jgi:Ni,Fe-hydrogenase III small subunit/Pyruvate/2-oxoacid:ferredoxin oxidoreductase delta subunit